MSDLTRGLLAVALMGGMCLSWSRAAVAENGDYTTTGDAPSVPELAGLELQQLLQIDVEVWSATKVNTKIQDVAAVVTVVSRREIQEWGYSSVAEVLRHTLGFHVVDDHIFPNVSVRGVSGGLWSESGIIKVMVEGRALSFRSTGGHWLGPELIPLSAVERIEIIRGPSSALYGADAFMGVVNIILRKGENIGGGELIASGLMTGRNAGFGQEIAVGGKSGGFDVFVAYRNHHRDLAGLRLPESSPSPNLPIGVLAGKSVDNLSQDSHTAVGRVVYRWRETTFSLNGYGSMADRDAAFSPWIQLAEGLDGFGRQRVNHVSLQHGHVGLRVESRLSRALEVILDATYFAGGPTVRDRLEIGSNLYRAERDFGFHGTDVGLEARWTGVDDLVLTGGATLVYDREDLLTVHNHLKADIAGGSAGDVVEEASSHQGMRSFTNPAAYAQAMYSGLRPNLNITGGVRFDNHNIYGNQLSGRLGLVSNPIKNLHGKFLYGSAFKAPSPFLLHAVPLRTGDVVGNQDLQPQFVHTVESQLSYRLTPSLSATTSVSYNYLRDKASFTALGLNKEARNTDVVETFSWETGIRYAHRRWVDAYLNVGYVSGRRDTGLEGYQGQLIGRNIGVYPDLMIHGGVNARLPWVPLRIAVTGSYIGARRASDDNVLGNAAPYDLDPYVMLGSVISTREFEFIAGHETRLSLVMRNLLDADVGDAGYAGIDYPLAPREFILNWSQEL